MTISNRRRRRNRWRKKLRTCTQCKHFWSHHHEATWYAPEDWEWGCHKEESPDVLKLYQPLVEAECEDEETWWEVARKCPHYQAFDREANLNAQRLANQKASAAIWRSANDLYHH